MVVCGLVKKKDGDIVGSSLAHDEYVRRQSLIQVEVEDCATPSDDGQHKTLRFFVDPNSTVAQLKDQVSSFVCVCVRCCSFPRFFFC